MIERRLTLLVAAPAMVGVAAAIFWSTGGDPWLGPTVRHPLGTDEFGRDLLATLLVAVLRSAAEGFVLALSVLVLSLSTAGVLAMTDRGHIASELLLSAARTLEAVPLLLWVLVAAAVAAEFRWFSVAVVFVIAAYPATAHIVSGEVRRQRSLGYVEAAIVMGVRPLRILLRHMLPNAIAVLTPLTVQLAGAAIAINGAIGLLGMGNRSALDVGTFLLRGKESFWLHPSLLLFATAAFAMLYGYLWLLLAPAPGSTDEAD